MKVHINSGDGGAKCGVNVCYKDYIDNKHIDPASRTIRKIFVCFEDQNRGLVCNCKRCLNKIARPSVIESTEDLTGKVFHYSFGYDMTFNVFARPIKKTAKGWICQEVSGISWGDDMNGTCRMRAGNELKKESKPFLMTFKQTASGQYKYWTGQGNTWRLIEADQSHYENHCD